MAPSYMSLFECVPEWACCKLRDEEDFTVSYPIGASSRPNILSQTFSTVPLVFSTAIHALEDRAALQPGEVS